ncbi:hypothetical protein U1Q18_040363 [Sarracenia purpurea var. burkii]
MEFSRFFWLEPPQGFNAGTYGFTLDEVPPDLRKLKVPLDLSPICVLQSGVIFLNSSDRSNGNRNPFRYQGNSRQRFLVLRFLLRTEMPYSFIAASSEAQTTR